MEFIFHHSNLLLLRLLPNFGFKTAERLTAKDERFLSLIMILVTWTRTSNKFLACDEDIFPKYLLAHVEKFLYKQEQQKIPGSRFFQKNML